MVLETLAKLSHCFEVSVNEHRQTQGSRGFVGGVGRRAQCDSSWPLLNPFELLLWRSNWRDVHEGDTEIICWMWIKVLLLTLLFFFLSKHFFDGSIQKICIVDIPNMFHRHYVPITLPWKYSQHSSLIHYAWEWPYKEGTGERRFWNNMFPMKWIENCKTKAKQCTMSSLEKERLKKKEKKK